MSEDNTLYYGDNLEILRDYIKDESVDLIYLDPPFKSDHDYNILFAEKNGTQSESQIKAFEDTWHWDITAARAYEEMVQLSNSVSDALVAFRTFLGENDMMAYLSMMAPRLIELKRVLKSTGSIYLHCDTVASHYLKLLMDAVFNPVNFRNEIIWKRTSAHSDSGTCGRTHDILLFYTKTNKFTWNKQYQPYDQSYVDSHYRYLDENGRRYRTDNLTAGGLRGGGYEYEWNGIKKVWRCPIETMMNYEKLGRIHHTRTGTAEYIRYLDEMPGVPLQDIWVDIPPINPQAKERLPYPTQKPEALLERIIEASSNEDDTVLDPFCGCGTSIAVAHRLNRKYIGIDITHLAISLIKHRLIWAYGKDAVPKTIGEPTSLAGAKELAKQDKYQFEWWALSCVGAGPAPEERKKGADRGIDGRLYFFEDTDKKVKPKQIIFSVKGGNVTVSQVRDLLGVVEREKAAMGVFITMKEPTKPMRTEAANSGFYIPSGLGNEMYQKIQIITIADLVDGKGISCPPHVYQGGNITFKRAPKSKVKKKDKTKQQTLKG